MYKIIGGDQKQDGPVSSEEVRKWIRERRLQGGSLIQLEGTTDWKPLTLFPEFSSTLAQTFPSPEAVPTTFSTGLVEQRSNSMAVTGLVLGCVALFCCGCFPAAVLGLVFSFIGLSQANRDPAQSGKSIAIAGIVIGSIALLGNVLFLAMGAMGNIIEALGR